MRVGRFNASWTENLKHVSVTLNYNDNITRTFDMNEDDICHLEFLIKEIKRELKNGETEMKPITFPEVNEVYAKDQKEYLPLPVRKNEMGLVTSCWQLTFKERVKVLFTGVIWFDQHTFNQPLQPQRPYVDCEFVRDKTNAKT